MISSYVGPNFAILPCILPCYSGKLRGADDSDRPDWECTEPSPPRAADRLRAHGVGCWDQPGCFRSDDPDLRHQCTLPTRSRIRRHIFTIGLWQLPEHGAECCARSAGPVALAAPAPSGPPAAGSTVRFYLLTSAREPRTIRFPNAWRPARKRPKRRSASTGSADADRTNRPGSAAFAGLFGSAVGNDTVSQGVREGVPKSP
jgi:hypothetical protein